MFSGGNEISRMSQSSGRQGSGRIYVVIREQPASKALRFRYECEGRSAGSIPGVTSSPENKTYPTIQVVGYHGRAMVVVSCVTKDEPYRPHPHNLVGREGCRRGVCTLEIPQDTMTVQFSNLGIQCVKKKDIEEHLRVREEIRVDPFRTGYSHRNQPTTIDLNAVRLCFQVFLEQPHTDKEGNTTLKFTKQLEPVVSDPIFDKKAMSDLVITHLCSCTTSVAGSKDDVIILLCEKVAKEDIQVRFYEEVNGKCVWEGFGEFPPSHVHKQTAIKLRTPRYKTLDVTEPVKVNIQLRRPSDGATSEPKPFMFRPLDSDSVLTKRKRPKHDPSSRELYNTFHDRDQSLLTLPPYESFPNNPPNQMELIKTEPGGSSPYRFCGDVSPSFGFMPNDSLPQQPAPPILLEPTNERTMGTSPSPVFDPFGYCGAVAPNIPLAVPSVSPSRTPEYQPPFENFGQNINMPSTSSNAFSGSVMYNIGPGPINNQPKPVNMTNGFPSDVMNRLEESLLNQELPILTSGNLNDALQMDTNNLSENLSMRCSLSDIKMEHDNQNIPLSTDSLTRFANEAHSMLDSHNKS